MAPRISRTSEESHLLSTSAGNIPYLLCRSRRRTMSITITAQAEVRVAAPCSLPEAEIRKFVQSKHGWISRKLQEVRRANATMASREYADEQKFLFLGKSFPLQMTSVDKKRGQVQFDGRAWQVELPVSITAEKRDMVVKNLLTDWYREQAREVFPGRIFNYSRIMGLDPQTIAVKTQRRSWGSCGYRRRSINLNWQLVMAPIEVLDYVVVHELAHLVHPNHSSRFWKKVEKFMPDYKIRKRWLQANRLQMMLP